MNSLIAFLVFLLLFITSCASHSSLEDLITIPNSFTVISQNDPTRNHDLAMRWNAKDVAHMELMEQTDPSNKNLLTLSQYSAEDFASWYNTYLDEKTAKVGNDTILLSCNFSPLDGKDIQICGVSAENFTIQKYTFEIQQIVIVRILCFAKTYETSTRNCHSLTEAIIKKSEKTDFS
jgi:hypothetical protein